MVYVSVWFLVVVLVFFVSLFFFYCSGHHRDLHSFPTRRSSDLSRNLASLSRTVCSALRRSAISTCSCAAWRWISDRKSTRLNSSHITISYAVFCLKKKNHNNRKHNIKKKHNFKKNIINYNNRYN